MKWKGNDAEGQWKKSIDLGPQPRVKGEEEKDENVIKMQREGHTFEWLLQSQ